MSLAVNAKSANAGRAVAASVAVGDGILVEVGTAVSVGSGVGVELGVALGTIVKVAVGSGVFVGIAACVWAIAVPTLAADGAQLASNKATHKPNVRFLFIAPYPSPPRMIGFAAYQTSSKKSRGSRSLTGNKGLSGAG